MADVRRLEDGRGQPADGDCDASAGQLVEEEVPLRILPLDEPDPALLAIGVDEVLAAAAGIRPPSVGR